jgi:hypothetical protein
MRNLAASLVLPVAAFLSAQKPTPPRPIPARTIQTAPVAPQPAPTGPRLPGTNAFHTVFDRDATGRHDGNAYLLMYLSSAIYPEMLDRLTRRDLNDDKLNRDPALFEKEYEALTRHLFFDTHAPIGATNREPAYEFITSTEPGGYDPEAMVIDTHDVIYVVFRGTDRVASAKDDSGYQWNEWLKTDFDFLGMEPGEGLRGKVHAGFWKSLLKIRNRLTDRVIQLGGRDHKKVWITGHSLGAGQAQLFGAWLAISKAVPVQGVYAFAAPQVGDKQFVNDMNAAFWKHKMQCFEFVDDPVTMLALYIAGYERGGVRCYYDDVDSYTFEAKERPFTDAGKILPSILGVALNGLEGAIHKGRKVRFNLAGSEFCYHYQAWYVQAAFKQLNRVQRSKCPPALGIPSKAESPCSLLVVARGKSNKPEDQAAEIVDAGAQVVEDVIERVAYNVKSLLDNATGSAIAEGTYTIRCNKGGRALQWKGPIDDGSPVELHEANGKSAQKWTVKRDGAVGYTISSGGRFLDVAAEDLFDNGAKIQMWAANLPFGCHAPNQHWLFYKVGKDRYLLINLGSTKALDAVNKDTGKNGGRVQQWQPGSDDQSMVWIVEKA